MPDDHTACCAPPFPGVAPMPFAEGQEVRQVPFRQPHIGICICTYRRPHLLKRLLDGLCCLETKGLFGYSVVVVDNDELQSARETVADFARNSGIAAAYHVEPRRGIAMARNKVVQHATGDYVAFIDDDEFPARDWLLRLFEACGQYQVDGVLGPVKPHFDRTPPAWLEKSGLLERRVVPTGTRAAWPESRTGNVLLRRSVLDGEKEPFRPDLKIGEDQDFFRRKIAQGRVFIWCAEAEAFEVVPASRWTRRYMIRRALLRGDNAVLRGERDVPTIAKSAAAVPLYLVALPFAQLCGHHCFMTLLVKLCDHAGKLLALIGIHPIKDAYINEEPQP